MSRLKVKGRSVAPLKLPTEFAELNCDLTTYVKGYLDCSGCENIDAPDSVIEYLSAAIRKHPELVWDHWSPQDKNIKEKIAKLHQVDVNQVFITSGAISGIDYCFKVFATSSKKTGLLKPDWPGFEHYADFYKQEKLYLENFSYPFCLSAEQIGRFVHDRKPDMLVFANPVPVQGNLLEVCEIDELLTGNPETLFVVDEADTVMPAKQAACLATKHDNVIFLGSFSKFYGLSGLRVGYLISPKVHAQHFGNTINVLEVSSLAILAANVVLTDESYQKQTQENVVKALTTLKAACQNTHYEIGGHPHCFAAFIHSNVSNPRLELEEFNVKILPAQYFGLPDDIKGGRFNLSNPENALRAASVLGKTAALR